MLIKELKRATSNKCKITPRAIAYRADNLNKNYGPFSKEVAYGIVAQQSGVEVSKIISDPKIIDEIRNQIDRINEIASDTPKQKTKTIYKTKILQVTNDIKINDPILDKRIFLEAKEMTIYYAQLYIFENSVREIINRVLSKNIGKNWWNIANVNQDLLDKVQGRIDKESKNPWHGRRGAHPIYYSDISDLIYLLRRHWNLFNNLFPRLEWVTEKLEQVSFSRNVVDHHNPLSKRDRDRLTMNLNDWESQIDANKANI